MLLFSDRDAGILKRMSTSILVGDITVPFAESLEGTLGAKGLQVVPVAGIGNGTAPASGHSGSPIAWNRPSPLSARTVMTDAFNRSASLDTAVLVFGLASAGALPGEASDVVSARDPVRLTDEWVRGYLLLVSEIVRCFSLRKKGRIVFVLSPVPPDACLALHVAEAAFCRLAEETASRLSIQGNPEIQTLLVRLETAGTPADLDWLSSMLEQPSFPRPGTRWIKSGSRGLFGKF